RAAFFGGKLRKLLWLRSTPLRRMLVRALQHLAEPVEKRRLAFQNTFPALGNGKPTSAIYLGNFDHTAGARRPFQLTMIADHRGGVAITLKSPGNDNLSA